MTKHMVAADIDMNGKRCCSSLHVNLETAFLTKTDWFTHISLLFSLYIQCLMHALIGQWILFSLYIHQCWHLLHHHITMTDDPLHALLDFKNQLQISLRLSFS